MRKILLIALLVIAVQIVQAQDGHKVQIRGGLGFAGYGSKYEQTYSFGGINFSDSNTDGAATFHFPLEVRVELNRRFNVGLDMKFGSYLYDPDSADGKSNRFVVVGLAGEYNFVVKEKLRWYGGVGFNGCSLVLEETKTENGIKITNQSTYSGPGFRMNTGVLIFLIKGFGLNFNLGYDSHNFTLRKFEQNGQDVSLDNFDATLKVSGVDGTLGLFVRF
ncbi:hypothetical protein BH11BAC2_BH11BAC2_05500 [soil metagenome]